MTEIEVTRVDPAEALRRTRERLVKLSNRSCGFWGEATAKAALLILDEEWPNGAEPPRVFSGLVDPAACGNHSLVNGDGTCAWCGAEVDLSIKQGGVLP